MKTFSSSRLLAVSLALAAVSLSSCKRNETPVAVVTPAPIQVIDTIFLPGADDALHPRKVSRAALDTQLKSGGNPTPALNEIIKKAPQWFPKGTRVVDVKDNGKVVTILLSPEFGDEKHWSKGERTTQLAVYALVNTVAKNGKTVALTLEGKPIETLGEFDASDPIEANLDLNAKK